MYQTYDFLQPFYNIKGQIIIILLWRSESVLSMIITFYLIVILFILVAPHDIWQTKACQISISYHFNSIFFQKIMPNYVYAFLFYLSGQKYKKTFTN